MPREPRDDDDHPSPLGAVDGPGYEELIAPGADAEAADINVRL